jgi:hypothetical protein
MALAKWSAVLLTLSLSASLHSVSTGASIGIHFAITGGGLDNLLPVDGAVGVVPQTNWVNIHTSDFGITTPLNDDQGNGVATTLKVSNSPRATVNASNTTISPPIADLLHAFVLTSSLSIIDIPYSTYDVYVYVEQSISPRTAETLLLNTSTQILSDEFLAAGDGDAALTEADSQHRGSYVHFTDVRGADLMIGGSASGFSFPPIDAIQIVETPEPAGLCLLGIGGLLAIFMGRNAIRQE